MALYSTSVVLSVLIIYMMQNASAAADPKNYLDMKTTNPGGTTKIILQKTLVQCNHPHKSSERNYSNHLSGCKHKVLISLKLINTGKATNADQVIVVSSVEDAATGVEVHLYTPLVVQVAQDQMSVAYPFKHLQSVNNKPYELVISQKRTSKFRGCVDTKTAQDICATLANGPGSQSGPMGFCCTCMDDSITENRNNSRQFRHQSCEGTDTFQDNPAKYTSAHCLRFDPLWYSVNILQKPRLHHSVTLQVYSKGTGPIRRPHHGQLPSHWTSNKQKNQWKGLIKGGVVVGTDVQSALSRNKKVLISYSMDLDEPEIFPFDVERHRLLIPEPIVSPPVHDFQHKGDAESYLVVDKDDISSDGTACDKIGASYPAFVSQDSRCQQNVSSCLQHQPMDLWLENEKTRSSFSPTRLGSHGHFASPPLVRSKVTKDNMVRFIQNMPYTAELQLEVNADDLIMLAPGYHTEISQIVIARTISRSMSHNEPVSEVKVTLTNYGVISANYTVRLVDCTAQQAYSSVETVHIQPQMSGDVRFMFAGQSDGRAFVNQSCVAEVQNTGGQTIASRHFWYIHEERCFCVAHCQCVCVPSSHSLACAPLPIASYQASGFHGDIRHVHIIPHVPLLSDSQVVTVVVCLLVSVGLLKSILGITVSSEIWNFGVSEPCSVDNWSAKLKIQTFCNVFFCFVSPLLILLWFCKTMHRGLKKTRSLMEQQIPLLPERKWSDILVESKDPVYQTLPSPVTKSPRGLGPGADLSSGFVFDEYVKHKHQLGTSATDDESPETSLAEENDHSIFDRGQHQLNDLLEKLCQAKSVFCNYTEASPHLNNSGELFSLCGELTEITSDLLKFSLSLNTTQVYENATGEVASLTSLEPIKTELFDRIISKEEVTRFISEKPLFPCLNKLM